MILQFTIKNYRSFIGPSSLNLLANASKEFIDSTVKLNNKTNVLKAAVIYGANASGKSNVIAGFKAFRDIVVGSYKEGEGDSGETDLLPVESFRLNTSTSKKPSSFEIVLENEGIIYTYGFEATRKEIKKEWLFKKSKRETLIFSREKGDIQLFGEFKKEANRLQKFVSENALFLPVVAKFNGKISKQIYSSIRRINVISGLEDMAYRSFATKMIKEIPSYRELVVKTLKAFDVGIKDINIATDKNSIIPESIPSEVRDILQKYGRKIDPLAVVHDKYNTDGKKVDPEIFDFDNNESKGTQKLILLLAPLIDTIVSGKVLIIDEFDSRLHPLITKALLNFFLSAKWKDKRAQLIFATHDTNLLDSDLLRKEQIWFVEKDKFANSHLYSLADYKTESNLKRSSSNYRKNYIHGRYGAIPFIGNFNSLIEG